MKRWVVMLGLAAAGCSSVSTPRDAGVVAGPDAGGPVTDGGVAGSACLDLDQCGGNPLCAGFCPPAVICADKVCTQAGGPASYEVVSVRFSTARLPTYMNITVLAPQLVKGGTLDCPTLLQGLDAGTLNPTDSTVVNPLVVAYQRSVTITSKADVEKFPTSEAASGPGRVLLLDAYLSTAAPDGGDQFLGRACAVFDNSGGDAGTVGITVAGP